MAQTHYGRRVRAPATERLYKKTLTRAFGDAPPETVEQIPAQVLNWPETGKKTLAAALLAYFGDRGVPEQGRAFVSRIPFTWQAQPRQKRIAADEVDRLERAIGQMPPRERVMLTLLLRCGLRGEELLNLSREDVQESLRTGVLVFVAKGGKRRSLPVDHVMPELRALLRWGPNQLRQPARGVAGDATWEAARAAEQALAAGLGKAKAGPWQTVGDVVGGSTPGSRHAVLGKLVKKAARLAGLDPDNWHPHMLRHAFATRMQADGAPPRVIMRALGHAQLTTTQVYLHADDADVARYMRTKDTSPAATQPEQPEQNPDPEP